MVPKFVVACALVVMVGAGVVCAGTPFGGDDTDTIPSDAPKGPVTKCKVAKQTSKLIAALVKCHIARASGKLADDTAEDQCEATAETKFEVTKLTGCAACTVLTTLATATEGLVDSDSKHVYCSTGSDFGGDDSGKIPPDAPKGPVTKCENRVAKSVGRLVGGIIKCHIGASTRPPLFRNNAAHSGAGPSPEPLAVTHDCGPVLAGRW
jgi:hypothetical protein